VVRGCHIRRSTSPDVLPRCRVALEGGKIAANWPHEARPPKAGPKAPTLLCRLYAQFQTEWERGRMQPPQQ
jgi:hypothetical protein